MFGLGGRESTAKTREGLPGGFVELSAGVTHYEVRGDPEAEPVVLIHGNAAPYVTWDNTIDDLVTAGLRVLRYDVFGHGLSDRPKLPRYDYALYTTQLAELLTGLDISHPVSIVGTSQGGSIGACFASANPGAVERLALLAPLFDDVAGSTSVLFKALGIRGLGELILRLVPEKKAADLSGDILSSDKRAALESGVLEQFRIPGKRRAVLANWRGDVLEAPPSCYEGVKDQGIPLLLTWGTRDRTIPGDSMARLRDLIPDTEYHQVDGAGHLAHYEFPDRINPLLVRFLTD